MKAPLSWLKDYVDIDVTAEELQKKLFSCGFEVEELISVGKDINKVVVGEVVECLPIEGTHLHVCKVNCGEYGTVQICCGADNVAEGGKYPTALVGATVYETERDHVTVSGVMTIKKGKLRGYESFGMLCSGVELGVNEDMYEGAGYNGLLVLPKDSLPGADVKPILGLDDYIFDIGITANRPDCQSILGIAREVAAVLGKPLKEPDYSYTEHDSDKNINVTVEAYDLCPRYIGHYVSDIKMGESPRWMKKRLALCGIRSISNIVDITNFVLLEQGQPMHAFDLATISGEQIVVRRAKTDETIVTLDEKLFKLNQNNLVICDGEKPVALAGVMGGLNSGITDTTKEVLFEAAKFARDNVRKTARALGQSSDSSSRFEKGIDEYTTVNGMKRALHLIEELNCGVVTNVERVASVGNSIEGRKMTVSVSKINALLGIVVPDEKIVEILTNLNFRPEISGDALKVIVPPYRDDVEGYPDIAEEIIRMYGYDNIHSTFLEAASVTNGGLTQAQLNEKKLKNALVAQCFYESVSYSFFSPKDFDLIHLPKDAAERNAVRILNPIREDLSVMRTTLAPSMISAILRNLKNGNNASRLFELSNIYIPEELPLKKLPTEKQTLCLGVFGNGETFFTVKGVLEALAAQFRLKFTYAKASRTFLHPGMTAEISCNQKVVGYLGKLSHEVCEENDIATDVYIAQLDYELLSEMMNTKFIFKPLVTEVKRDLALIADEAITCGEIEETVRAACKAVSEIKLFDIYRGEQIGAGKKSMAFALTFTPEKDKTLSASDVDKFEKKILNNLRFKHGIERR